MPEVNHCADCGAALPAYWPQGLCVHCALEGVLDVAATKTRTRCGDAPSASIEHPASSTGALPSATGGTFGDYELLEEIGRGGMGVVYRARQISLNRTVALKMILAGRFASRQDVLRFRAEAEAAAILRHPNVVAIHETGEHEGRHYFSMDYVQGRNLAEIAHEGPLAARRVALYARMIAAGIHYAHEQGVLHRDLKPSNILIDENDQPRITDFGLAKRARGDFGLTVTGQLLGSPNFMPPEQTAARSGKVGPASDVYGIGAIVYHLLTGRPPFQAETIEAVLGQLHASDPVAPRLLNPSIPRDLETICLKCLEKDPAKRYRTARALADELGRFVRNEPIQARAVRTPEKIWRWCRRKPVLALLILLVHVVGAAGLAGILWQWQRVGAKKAELEKTLYFNHVALAHREATSAPVNVKEAERLLDDSPPGFRNWEWHYLKRRRYSDPLRLSDPESHGINSVSSSPDGRHLASGGAGGRVRIWELAEGRVVQTLPGHEGFVASVAFSPTNPDRIASAGSDKRLVLWDWRTGENLGSWPTEIVLANGLGYATAFSPDGQRLASPGEDGEVIIRDTTTGTVLFVLPRHEEMAKCVSFSPDGRWMATGSSGGVLRLWDATTGQPVKQLGQPGPPISNVAFSRDGKRLVAAYVHGFVGVWNTETQRPISFYRAGSPALTGLALHPDAERTFTAGSDRLVTVSETDTGREALVLRELTRQCACLVLSPDGNRLAAASRDGSVHVWDATPLRDSADQAALTLHYPGEVWALEVSRDGRAVAIAGERALGSPAGLGAPVVVAGGPGYSESLRIPGHLFVIFSLSYNPTGRLLAFSGDGDEPARPGKAPLRVWDLASGREAFTIEASADDHRLFSVGFSRDGRWLVGGGEDRSIKVWDGATGRKVRVLGEHTADITKLAFSSDGRYLASVGMDDVVQVWDAARLEVGQVPLRRFAVRCDDYAADLAAFSPDGSRLAVASDDDTATIHDVVGDDNAVRLVCHGHRPLALAFTPDGRWVASGGKDCTVKVWDSRTGKQLETLRSHGDQVTRLICFQSAERVWLVSGSRDGTVKLWDLARLR